MTTVPAELSPDREARLSAVLAAAPLELILSKYRHATLFDASEIAALRIGGELDRRGIAPVFRLSDTRSDELLPEVRQIVALADLQWLRVRYPAHVPAWDRLRGVFDKDQAKALRAARFALWNGHRRPGQLVKALALTDMQLQELAWLIPAHAGRLRRSILERRHGVAIRIAEALRSSRDRRGSEEQAKTCTRREALWLCGELADWRPQRTAELFAMMPDGHELPRNVVGRQLDAVRDALSCKRG